jgi:hypothetical protein
MVHDHHPADPDRQNTVAACVGLSCAQVRHDDRVVAIHADTFGTLGARVDPHATGSYWT